MNLPKIHFLQRSFEFSERKTLKLKLRKELQDNKSYGIGVQDATEFLRDSVEYSRVEFECGGFYYVIARLKDESSTD